MEKNWEQKWERKGNIFFFTENPLLAIWLQVCFSTWLAKFKVGPNALAADFFPFFFKWRPHSWLRLFLPSNTCQSSQISQWALCLSKRGKHTTALSRRRARPLLETGGRQLPRKSLALLLCQQHFFFKWAPPTWTFPKNKFTVHLAPELRPVFPSVSISALLCALLVSDKTRQSMLTVHCKKKLKRKKTGRAAWVKGIEED